MLSTIFTLGPIVKFMSTHFLWFFPCVSRKMNTRMTPAKRVEENEVQEEIPPQIRKVDLVSQSSQVPIVGSGNDVLVVPQK